MGLCHKSKAWRLFVCFGVHLCRNRNLTEYTGISLQTVMPGVAVCGILLRSGKQRLGKVAPTEICFLLKRIWHHTAPFTWHCFCRNLKHLLRDLACKIKRGLPKALMLVFAGRNCLCCPWSRNGAWVTETGWTFALLKSSSWFKAQVDESVKCGIG